MDAVQAYPGVTKVLCVSGCIPGEQAFWTSLTSDPVAFFTLALAAFTLVLAVSTVGLWKATWNAAHLSEVQHIRSNRAFVYLHRFEHITVTEGGVNSMRVTAFFKNSGNTPTKNALISVEVAQFDGEIPDDFAYPLTKPATVAFIGPDAEIAAPYIDIPMAQVGQIANGVLRSYIYGNVHYRDVFKGTYDHTTEFCFKFDATVSHAGGWWVGFIPYGPRNRSDDDSRSIVHPKGVWGSFLAGIRDISGKH